eukprot:TRINITY_DN13473_c0_g1_i1.p1 TRINITY_DN13473_c0_g1~~TRINITY_DN13473_c0_g1_i1.p1  ORF type:complete len:398 (+),score=55.37 TRINITY_DN13473_c0_g1_i1:216-1409(+)
MAYRSIADNDEEYSLLPSEVTVTKSMVYGGDPFFSLDTPWAALVECLIVVSYFALLWIPFEEEDDGFLNGYNIRVTLYVFIYVFLVLSGRFVQWRHRQLRQRGYLSFYRKVRSMTTIPMHTWAAGVACVALLFVYLPAGNQAFGLLHPINWLQILVGLQMVVIVGARGYYIYLVIRRNRARQLPDARETLGLLSPAANSASSYSDQSDVVDKQADMIRYLQEQKKNLSMELLNANERIEALEAEGATTFEGDAAHQLSVKEQTIRTLQGEIDVLREQAQGGSKTSLDNAQDMQQKLKEQSAKLVEMEKKLADANACQTKLHLLFELEREINASLETELGQLRGTGRTGGSGVAPGGMGDMSASSGTSPSSLSGMAHSQQQHGGSGGGAYEQVERLPF